MSLSRDEFLRILPRAVALPLMAAGPECRRYGAGTGEVLIRFAEAGELRLGALALPVLEVGLDLSGFDPDEERRVLARFDLVFQRGGG